MTYRENLMRLRAHEERVFRVAALPEHMRPKAPPSPFTLMHTTPVPVPVEHLGNCVGSRTESVAWSGGVHVTRCIDCGASAKTGDN